VKVTNPTVAVEHGRRITWPARAATLTLAYIGKAPDRVGQATRRSPLTALRTAR